MPAAVFEAITKMGKNPSLSETEVCMRLNQAFRADSHIGKNAIKDGQTPLGEAVKNINLHAVAWLFDNGKHPDNKDLAIDFHYDASFKGDKDKYKKLPLSLAVSFADNDDKSIDEKAESERTKRRLIIDCLLEHKVFDCSTRPGPSSIALLLAIENENLYFLNKVRNLFPADIWSSLLGSLVKHLLCIDSFCRNEKNVRLLIEYVDKLTTNRNYLQCPGSSRLVTAACQENHLDSAQLMLSRGAEKDGGMSGWGYDSVKRKDAIYWPITAVLQNLQDKKIDLNRAKKFILLLKGSNTRPGHLLFAIQISSETELIKFLLETGTYHLYGGYGGITPLMKAAELGRVDIMDYLYSQGAGINTEFSAYGFGNSQKSPALRVALENGQSKAVEFLRERSAYLPESDARAASEIGERKKAARRVTAKNQASTTMPVPSAPDNKKVETSQSSQSAPEIKTADRVLPSSETSPFRSPVSQPQQLNSVITAENKVAIEGESAQPLSAEVPLPSAPPLISPSQPVAEKPKDASQEVMQQAEQKQSKSVIEVKKEVKEAENTGAQPLSTVVSLPPASLLTSPSQLVAEEPDTSQDVAQRTEGNEEKEGVTTMPTTTDDQPGSASVLMFSMFNIDNRTLSEVEKHTKSLQSINELIKAQSDPQTLKMLVGAAVEICGQLKAAYQMLNPENTIQRSAMQQR